MSCRGCKHCGRYLSGRAVGAAPTTIGGQELAQAKKGRCSKTWPAETELVYGAESRSSAVNVRAVGRCGRMEMFRESSEALLHTVSERGSQLQGKGAETVGGCKYARNGGGK